MSYVLTWITLMIPLALTFWSSYMPMGLWNTVVNMGISCLTAVAALVFLAVLFGLTSADYASRSVSSAPWWGGR